MNRRIATIALALLLLPATGWAAAIRLDRYVRDYAGPTLDADNIAKFTTSNRPAPVTTPSPCYALPFNDGDDLEPRVSDTRPANCSCTANSTTDATSTSKTTAISPESQEDPCAAVQDDEGGTKDSSPESGAADLLAAATGLLFDGFDVDNDGSPSTNFLNFSNIGLGGPGVSGGGFGGFAGLGGPSGAGGFGGSTPGGAGAGGSTNGLLGGGPSIELTNPTVGPGFPTIGPVELPPGTYVFSFDVSNGGASTETVVVTVFGSTSNYVSVELTVPGGSGPTNHTIPFVVIGPDIIDFDFHDGDDDDEDDDLQGGRTSLVEEIPAVPEPGTFALLAAGLLIAARRLRRRR